MAKANSASRSLIEISKTQGWDSTRIWDQEKGSYGESILPWDHAREPFDKGLGQVPDSNPLPATSGKKDPTGGPVMTEKLTFENPDVSRESRVSGHPKTTLSSPTPGKTGA